MPTEVTVGANHYSGWGHSPQYFQQNHYPMSHSMPAAFPCNPHLMTGPARALDCIPSPIPMPNGVLAKGIRNPYVPYAGETYRPAPTSAYGGLGGYRLDDGWEGAMGRAHQGHAPDLMSTAGAVLRQPIPGGMHGLAIASSGGSGGWQNSPSSFHNHARMTPSLSLEVPPPQGPPIHRSGSVRRPQGSPSSYSRSIPIEQGCGRCERCERCDEKSQGGGAGGPADGGGGRRMSDGMLPPLRGSPLRHHRDEGLKRHVSGSSSRKSGRRGSYSSEA